MAEPNIAPMTPGFNGTDAAEVLINTKYSDTMSKTDDVAAEVTTALTDMLNLIDSWDNVWEDVSLGAADFATSFDLSQLPSEAPENPITAADYQQIAQGIPGLTFSFSQDAAPEFETLLSTLKSKLSSVINGSGTGFMGAAAEQAMYQREEARDLQALSDAKQKVAADWNKRRFPLPGAGLFSANAELDGKYMDRMLDRSREVTVEARKAEMDNMQFALKEASGIVQYLVDYKSKYWDRELTRAKELISATLEIFKAKIEVVKTKAQTFEAENQAFAARVGAIVKIVEGEIAVINAKVNYSEAEARVDIENLKGKLGEAEFKYNATDSINKAKANIYSQLYASLLGAVSASAHVQASLSGNVNYNTGVASYYNHNLSS